MSSLDTDLQQYEIPNIYVTDPGYDDMGEILDQLGVQYQPFSQIDLQSEREAVVMVNCSPEWRGGALSDIGEFVNAVSNDSGSSPLNDFLNGLGSNNPIEEAFGDFIKRGGSAIISDHAGELLKGFTESTFDTLTGETTVTASIEDGELAELLGRQELSIEFDLAGWYKPDNTPMNSKPLLVDVSNNQTLAYKFEYGEGDIVYTAFHNHAQTSAVEKALLKLLLMIPIADSADTSLTDTYTTITGSTVADSGRTVIDDTTTMDGNTNTKVNKTRKTEVKLDIIGGGSIIKQLQPGEKSQFGRTDFDDHLSKDVYKYVSGNHFEIENRDDEIIIRDKESTNGTTVNGNDISNGKPIQLLDGTEVALAGDRVHFVANID